MKKSILVVEDDKAVRNLITTSLSMFGYRCSCACNGAGAIMEAVSVQPDLFILDLGLPDMDGVSIIESVRTWSDLPIIVISARMQERDKVQALDLGADDYITKPFGSSELLARVRTAIRHSRAREGSKGGIFAGKLKIGYLTIDFDKHQVLVENKNVHLTQNEFRIVALLGRNVGRVLTYDFLLKEIWGPALTGDNQILRVNMANIRRKIEENPADPKYIFTEIGVGYRMLDVE